MGEEKGKRETGRQKEREREGRRDCNNNKSCLMLTGQEKLLLLVVGCRLCVV